VRGEHSAWVAKLKKRPEAKELLEHYKANQPEKLTLNASIRNGVRAIALAKQENETKVFQFNVGIKAVAFTVAALAAVTVITLSILSLVGVVVLAPYTLPFIGIGLTVFSLALVAAGLLFFAYTRPHLFKTYFSLTRTKLIFTTLPQAFHELNLKRKRIEELHGFQKIHEVSARLEQIEGAHLTGVEVSTEEKEKILLERRELEKRQAKLQQEIDATEAKVHHWKEKTNTLKREIWEANWKDLKPALGSNITLDETIHALVEAITAHPENLEEQTKTALSTELGLDLGRLQDKEHVQETLQNFFFLSERALTRFIREQQHKLELDRE
jgi:hypothetical protein